ncbi:MAG: T9SS type A sorting domain-containing protein [Bacteroidales bacterium]|nr:T9SS type A sorting domain-containing protein [Bacteroidales bacterium]
MNRIHSYCVLSLLVLLGFFSPKAMAQDLPYLNSFSLAEINGKVYLQWIIASGNTCDGVRVYRSTDAENFEQIGQIAGICGSPFSSVSYDYWDTLPLLNTTSYYHLELGNLGFSATQAIQLFDFSKKSYQIIPHPTTADANIYFENSLYETFGLHVFNQNGKLVYDAKTSSNNFELNPAQLDAGFYVFYISNNTGTNTIKGKLIAK